MNQPVVTRIQRYRVSLWTCQFSSPEDAPLYLRKETVASTEVVALQNIMRQAGIQTIRLAKVVALCSGTCQWLEQDSLCS